MLLDTDSHSLSNPSIMQPHTQDSPQRHHHPPLQILLRRPLIVEHHVPPQRRVPVRVHKRIHRVAVHDRQLRHVQVEPRNHRDPGREADEVERRRPGEAGGAASCCATSDSRP
ncbi:hypothetical protein CCMA1212_002567 [Trichoderma ghanense]|uniref:Uncharacterized protein n=1 Tax=Trichoderma ghanense TaxID=65468 RepID=A0ABY2HAS4_9HYPO